MSKYERDLRARLKNPTRWPEFERPDFLDRLDRVAVRALGKRSIEGHLAAILIYHQLVEEMLKLLTQDSQLLVQAALRPRRIDFPVPSRQVFGKLQQQLRSSVDFPQKDRMMVLADEINRIRVEIVHKLTRRGSLAGLGKDAAKARRLYERIFVIFDQVHDGFRVGLSGFRKDLL